MFLVIQHLILDGRTTDAIEKTKELFPTLLNDKNLLFVLKVRQFIEMVNGTESEIRSTSTSSQMTTTTNNLLVNNKTRSDSPSSSSLTNKNSSNPITGHSLSQVTKTNTSSRSRSNSPYTSGRTQTTLSGAQHSNGTVNSSSRRLSANNSNELSQDTNNESQIPCQSSESNNHPTTVNSLSSNTNSNAIVNLMDIDDNLHNNNNTANGFSNHGTVTHTSSNSTNQISNGHSLLDDNSNNLVVDHNLNSNGCSKKSSDILDGMEYDGYTDSTHTMDMESTTVSSDVQNKSTMREDDQLLIRILQFGRELHALKQQLNIEHGDNQQNDKLLQVIKYFSKDKKTNIPSIYFRMHLVY